MIKYVIFLFACCITVNSFSQKIIINGKEGNRPLKWEDFKGRPDDNSPFFAITYWKIAFGYTGINFKSDTADLKGLVVVLEFEPAKSWAKKSKANDYLLNHEQGHFDIAIICLKEITELFKNTVFMRSDLNPRINAMFDSTLSKYRAMEKKYDEETNHSIDTEQQIKWERIIKEGLSGRSMLNTEN